MNIVYEDLIGSFLESKVGICTNFIDVELSTSLRDYLLESFTNNKFYTAQTGLNSLVDKNNLIRNDEIYWLDRSHGNIFENQFLNKIDSFVSYLNKTCFTGITNYEFHYTYYPIGSFYKKHIDQFQDNNSRAYSMIFYLNPEWIEGHGGELKVYSSKNPSFIEPHQGTMVFFDSLKLPHEVLMTHVPRLSITGWLRRD